MSNSILTYRLARRDDLEALKALMDAAISELQRPFLDESQIASSRAIMGLDTQLIDDGTYFIDAILENKSTTPSFYDGYKAQQVIEAALQAHSSGNWVIIN